MKPNILLLMCDQLRYDCVADKAVHTPNLDRLRKSGVMFTNAYSQTPVCIPARHSLVSGQNAFEIGLPENCLDLTHIQNPLAELMRKQGYYTCAVGKMHFIPARAHFGFDHMYLSEEIPDHIEDDEFLKFLKKQGYGHIAEPHGKRSEQYYVPQTSALPEELHTTAWTAMKTIDVLKKNKNRPFFLFSSFIKPHPPFDPCEPYCSMYPPEEMPLPLPGGEVFDDLIPIQNGYKVDGFDKVSDAMKRELRSHYYACVTQTDHWIGKILDYLEASGLYDNTLIIFTADHGEMLGDHGGYGKRTYYEESCKIPLIVSCPGLFLQGAENASPAILQDIYATILSAAGGSLPDTCRGENLAPVCEGMKNAVRDTMIAQYGRGRQFKAMLREGDLKYLYFANGRRHVLYNLKEDPQELHPVLASPLFVDFKRRIDAYFADFSLEVPGYDDYVAPATGSFINQFPAWFNRT